MYFFSLSLSVADKRTKGNGITCPTIEWLKSFLLPKLHKWMIEDGAKFSLGQSLRLVSVEKYSKKYEELKQKYKHFVKVMIILHLRAFCIADALSARAKDWRAIAPATLDLYIQV